MIESFNDSISRQKCNENPENEDYDYKLIYLRPEQEIQPDNDDASALLSWPMLALLVSPGVSVIFIWLFCRGC